MYDFSVSKIYETLHSDKPSMSFYLLLKLLCSSANPKTYRTLKKLSFIRGFSFCLSSYPGGGFNLSASYARQLSYFPQTGVIRKHDWNTQPSCLVSCLSLAWIAPVTVETSRIRTTHSSHNSFFEAIHFGSRLNHCSSAFMVGSSNSPATSSFRARRWLQKIMRNLSSEALRHEGLYHSTFTKRIQQKTPGNTKISNNIKDSFHSRNPLRWKETPKIFGDSTGT